jgi:sialate O-acetylesterase
LHGFELAGTDHGFHPARARIPGDRVVVTSDAVADPHGVRYAWRNNASEANLVNADGWPASPFVAERNP